MKYTLVTGGAGYIGSHFVDAYLRRHDRVIILDNLDHGYRGAVREIQSKYLRKKLEFVKADLRDKAKIDSVFSRWGFDQVVHFAALCIVGQSMENPGKYFENNVSGTINLLNAMSKYRVKHLVFSSSSAVYGGAQYSPIDENHPLRPDNPYGLAKLMVEEMLPWYELRYGLKYVALRYFNVCGASPDGRIGFASRYKQNKLVQDAVKAAVGLSPLHLTFFEVDTPDRSPVRDYVDVTDLAGAHIKALDYLKRKNKSEVINLGTGKGYSVKEIIAKVERVLGTKIDPIQGRPRKGDVARVYASNVKAKRLLGWQPTTPLEESIKNLANWYRAHPRGYAR